MTYFHQKEKLKKRKKKEKMKKRVSDKKSIKSLLNKWPKIKKSFYNDYNGDFSKGSL